MLKSAKVVFHKVPEKNCCQLSLCHFLYLPYHHNHRHDHHHHHHQPKSLQSFYFSSLLTCLATRAWQSRTLRNAVLCMVDDQSPSQAAGTKSSEFHAPCQIHGSFQCRFTLLLPFSFHVHILHFHPIPSGFISSPSCEPLSCFLSGRPAFYLFLQIALCQLGKLPQKARHPKVFWNINILQAAAEEPNDLEVDEARVNRLCWTWDDAQQTFNN